MVIVSHDREFLDQLCTKIVETERGVSHTYKGNYTQYLLSKAERTAQQYSAYEKQQKEIEKLVGLLFHIWACELGGTASSKIGGWVGEAESKGGLLVSVMDSFLRE